MNARKVVLFLAPCLCLAADVSVKDCVSVDGAGQGDA